VTPFAVFRRDTSPGARFQLDSWNDAVTIDYVRERTGFSFEHGHARPTEAITERESSALHALDPDAQFAAGV
jgi:glutaconate CoA-transferase, subunit B